jgi:polyferredoxin
MLQFIISILLYNLSQEAQMNDNSKQLKKMAIWTTAIFATIFAIVMAVLWIPLFNAGATALGAVGQAFSEGWVMILIALVLCVGTYAGYSFYSKNRK